MRERDKEREREREKEKSDHVNAESASFLSFFDRFVHVTEFERLTMDGIFRSIQLLDLDLKMLFVPTRKGSKIVDVSSMGAREGKCACVQERVSG